MLNETSDKIALNKLCAKYRALIFSGVAANDPAANEIVKKMLDVADRVAAPIKRSVKSWRLGDDVYREILDDKLWSLINRQDTDPENFSNLLLNSLRRSVIDQLRRRDSTHYILETDMIGAINDHIISPLEHSIRPGKYQQTCSSPAIVNEEELRKLAAEYKLYLRCASIKGLKAFRSQLTGSSYEQIAEEHKIPMGSVKSAIKNVRDMLKEHHTEMKNIESGLPDDMEVQQQALAAKIMLRAIDELIDDKSVAKSR